jgi:hypothetical protein
MAIEKFWPAVAPVPVTSPGTIRGRLQLSTTRDFFVKQVVVLTHPTFAPVHLEVKRVNSPTQLELGPRGGKITDRTNLTAYGLGSTLFAEEQTRANVPNGEHNRAVYQEEPAVALRSFLVDRYGAPVGTDEEGLLYQSVKYPFPVQVLSKVGGINALSQSQIEYVVPAGKSYQITQIQSGGERDGSVTLYRQNLLATSLILNGGLNSAFDVSQWPRTNGTLSAPTPDFSTIQKFEGAGSMRWNYSASASLIQCRQTFATPQDFSIWRYLSARFFNDAVTGVTRTISITLTSISGATRSYSLSGLVGSAPFLPNTWVKITGELEIPTATTGANFDLTSITSIAVAMQDSANRTGTVYWDAVSFEGSLDIRQRVFFPEKQSTPSIALVPALSLNAEDSILVVTKNLENQRGDFATFVRGVLI